MSSCGSNVGTETSAPLINVIANNARFDSNSHISQIPPQIIHTLRFFLIDYFPRFCNGMYWGQSCSVARNLEVHTVSYIIALLYRMLLMMHRMSG